MAWHLIRPEQWRGNPLSLCEWMIDAEADISNGTEPEQSGSIGSLAYTAGFGAFYQKDAHGAWKKIGGDSNG